MTDTELDALAERLGKAGRDERLATGQLYLDAAAAITALRAERDGYKQEVQDWIDATHASELRLAAAERVVAAAHRAMDEIQARAAIRAMDAELGVSEWEAFLSPLESQLNDALTAQAGGTG